MTQWRDIESAPRDGRRIWARRIYNSYIVKEGWAVWGINSPDAPMRFSAPGGLAGDIPASPECADTPRWLTEDRMFSFPDPTHWDITNNDTPVGASETQELLPCPFCGAEPSIHGVRAPEYWVMCDAIGCKAATEGFGSKDRAIAVWNRRAPNASPAGPDAETAWLIEHGRNKTPMYWTGESWGRWSMDHRKACRFARREDAFKVSLALGDPTTHPNNHKVVEHMWLNERGDHLKEQKS